MTSIELKDGEYILKYDFEAFIMLEDMFNKGIMEIIEEMQSNIGLKTITQMLLAGLKRHNSKLTLKQLYSKMELNKISYYAEILGSAFTEALGVKDNVENTGKTKGKK